jgi:hypothetical protein
MVGVGIHGEIVSVLHQIIEPKYIKIAIYKEFHRQRTLAGLHYFTSILRVHDLEFTPFEKIFTARELLKGSIIITSILRVHDLEFTPFEKIFTTRELLKGLILQFNDLKIYAI